MKQKKSQHQHANVSSTLTKFTDVTSAVDESVRNMVVQSEPPNNLVSAKVGRKKKRGTTAKLDGSFTQMIDVSKILHKQPKP